MLYVFSKINFFFQHKDVHIAVLFFPFSNQSMSSSIEGGAKWLVNKIKGLAFSYTILFLSRMLIVPVCSSGKTQIALTFNYHLRQAILKLLSLGHSKRGYRIFCLVLKKKKNLFLVVLLQAYSIRPWSLETWNFLDVQNSGCFVVNELNGLHQFF